MGDKEKKKDGEEDESDPRLDYMFQYLFRSFKIKPDKWGKMLANEEHKELLMKFLDNIDDDVLVFNVNQSGALIPIINYPPTLKSKSTYFIRREKEPITMDNIHKILIFGDMSSQPLEEFSVLVDQAWLPFLSNPKNHQGWPQVISDDVTKHIRDIKSVVYEARGKSHGEILLPMPVGVERVYEAEMEIIESEGDQVDLYLKTAIEGIIIKWVKQITDVLNEDPTDAFNNDKQPVPSAEIEFWSKRVKNMECIYDQLRDPRVKKMASILELTDSAYFESFKLTFRNVVAALAEARDINLFLKPLVKWLNALESAELEEINRLFDPMYSTICLIWSNSRYYCSSTKLINILKEICNLLIETTSKALDPGSLFQGEPIESLNQIRQVIGSLELFRNKYQEYRQKVSGYFAQDADVVEWNFHPELVFEQLSKFLERLKLLEELFKACDDYLKLEKVEIGGIIGKILSGRVIDIGTEFADSFAPFLNITYDPLDLNDPSFLEDYAAFKQIADDLDNKLASIFVNAFDDCPNIDSLFKLMNIAGPFMEREIICEALTPKLPVILSMFEKDIDVIKEIFDEHVQYFMVRGHMILDHYVPPTAGAIMWVQKLEKRILNPTEQLQNFEFEICDTPRAYHILDKKDEMLDLLNAFDRHVYTKWVTEVPPIIKKNLKMPLMLRNDETLLLRLNFTREFHAVLREVRYLKMLGKMDIPYEAEELFDREGDIRNWIFHLHRIIYWYNQIRVSSHPTEFDLIAEEIENIDALIDIMLEDVTWASLDAFDYIKAIHDLLENLHGRLEHAQNNVKRMTDLMLPWSNSPLYERKDGKPENLLALDDRKDRVERRYNEVVEVGTIIHKLMKQNYKLFLNIDEPDTESDEGDGKKKKGLFGDEYGQMGEEESGAEIRGKSVVVEEEELEEETEEGETEEEEEEEGIEDADGIKLDKETGEVVKKEGEGEPSKPKEGEGEPSEPKEGEAGKPKEGEGEAAESKEGEGKDGKPKEGEAGEPKEGEGEAGKPKEGEGEDGKPKEGEGEAGKPKEGEDGKPKEGEGKGEAGKPKEGEGEAGKPKEGEGEAGKPKEGEAGKPKEGEGEAGKPKEGEGEAGKAKEGEGEAGKPKEGEGEAGVPKEGELDKTKEIEGEGEADEVVGSVVDSVLEEGEAIVARKKKRKRRKKKKKTLEEEEFGSDVGSITGAAEMAGKDVLPVEDIIGFGEFEEGGEEEEMQAVRLPSLTESEELRLIERREIFNEKWKAYEEYVDGVVSQGLQSAISCSFTLFIEEMDDVNCQFPLLEVTLELQEPNMVFVPCLDLKDPNGFYALVESLLNDILDMAKLIPRVKKSAEVELWLEQQAELERQRQEEQEEEMDNLSIQESKKEHKAPEEKAQKAQEKEDEMPYDKEEGEHHDMEEDLKMPHEKRRDSEVSAYRGDTEDEMNIHELAEEINLSFVDGLPVLTISDVPPADNYMEDVEGNVTLCDVATEILCRVQVAINQAIEYANKFQEYAYLWLDDRQEFLNQFLKYGHALSPEEEELVGVVYEDGTVALRENRPSLSSFKNQIDYYEDLYNSLLKIESEKIICKWLRIDVRPFRHALLNTVCKWSNTLKQHLIHDVEYKLSELDQFIEHARAILTQDVETMSYDDLIKVIRTLYEIKERTARTDEMFEPIKDTMDMLKTYNVEFPPEVYTRLQELPEKWLAVKKLAVTAKQAVAPMMTEEMGRIRKRINLFDLRQQQYRDKFRNLPIFKYPCENPYDILDKANSSMAIMEKEIENLQDQASMFDITLPDFKAIRLCRKEARLMKTLWDYANVIESNIDDWKKTQWKKIDVEAMENECKKFGKELRGLDKEMRSWETYTNLEATIKNLLTSLRAVTELQNPAIRDRHWQQLMEATQVRFDMDEDTTLADLLELKLHRYEDEVKNIVDKSVKEMGMEKILKEIKETWATMAFTYEIHPRTNCQILVSDEVLIETLEENQVQLQNMMNSKYIAYFLDEVSTWQKKLSVADMVIQLWFDVQRTWAHLESVFIGSEDIRTQLPADSKRFEKINHEFIELLHDIAGTPNVIEATSKPNLYEKLEEIEAGLTKCEKALTEYLETKRLAFPRFYFVSSADLLDILSNGNQPELVAKHLTKLFDSMAKLKFQQQDGKNTKTAIGMFAKDGEYVDFSKLCDCTGKVETWLNRLTDSMRETVRHYFGEAVGTYDEKPRELWIFDYPAQVSLCGTQIWWTTEVGMAFARLEEGYENALKDYQKKQITQLNILIGLLCGELTKGDRQKIMTICTIDVHSRDVVAKLIAVKVENSSCFQWQTQLRHRWEDLSGHCFCNICDAQFRYAYEYLGCTPRLVITPLTDRCYITLTQSLHLIMGGAPAGPAGTGKTETTKDLGRAMGIMVYVFNCSEQMDYKSCANIYKGLAQTGAWGCFDEFNRISVEVLSVVAVQVKTILDAIKAKRTTFNFVGDIIALIPTVGMFITMNPGYAGRTELPENLKALFRPCAMVVPDFELICEIMLVAEGFQGARLLARKFITLYTLCKELLSKQDHYDWGLRAIKSVLVVAGSLKRGDRERPEDQVLMRALRDFNIPKIVTEDVPVFMGLIGDLFPALDVPRKRVLDFEALVKKSVVDLRLQPEDSFVLKIVQLEELLDVRHSVFVIGNAGTGKTMVWRSLFRTYQNQKRKPMYNDLNPKAVTNNELFGVINPSTREWKDGLFSVIMRDQANLSGDGPKWILLDGDIDPMWIESLNTLMDDNKVLTLASNERIALTAAMRLLFEISNLRTATPATVSRAGILYINPQDLGWNPYVTSWIDKRTNQSEKANLMILFDRYVPPCLDIIRLRMKKITPIADIAHIKMLCDLLECLLTPQNVPNDCPKDWYEIYFVFACIWAFGSSMFQDQIVDHRVEFTKWWTNEFKVVKIPTQGTVFDFVVEDSTKKFIPWTSLVKSFDLDYEIPLQSTLVDTAETSRLRYFMDLLMEKKLPLMLVGCAGSGKSVIIADKLNRLNENYLVTNVPFNFYTTSEMLQKILEKPLEKKAGRNYGPPGTRTMVYFVDDMNMPEVDTYGTVQPHTLIRQYMDYGHWYDRTKLSLKDIHNCMFISSMNPTAGSFTINPRLQRHFSVFAVNFPTGQPLNHIYQSILSLHLANPVNKIPAAVARASQMIVNAALALHQKVAAAFLPTADKFHYVFNLRDLSNIFQALLYSTPACIPTVNTLIRLWLHEATRVYRDKFTDQEDIEAFNKLAEEVTRTSFEEIKEEEIFHMPLIYCHFSEGLGEGKYLPIRSWAHLSRLLEEGMSQYNDLVGDMNLVLFEDAMEHVCRVNRILEGPRGNALLIGVGGRGKQSLSRLAAFIASLETFQVQLRKGYAIVDLCADINGLYMKAGLKNVGIMFLMTDAQVADEKFLVVINDLLASGEIPELFADDEADNIVNTVRNEVKSQGINDTRENCWKFFINKVRLQMKVVLCFSPVGSTLRVRARKFPAVVNCTSIDWFHTWPQTALESVSARFLEEIETLPEHLRRSVSLFMAFVHTSVNDASELYLTNERRYNYTTPKTFLEQINLYGKLLNHKTSELEGKITRLENGLLKLASTGRQVDGMKEKLADQEVVVAEKNEAANKLIAVVGKETEVVSKEKEYVAEEEAKVRVIEEDVSQKQKLCEADLKKAEPALLAAREALNTLNKNNLTELKSFGSPPAAVVNVTAAVLVLFSQKGKIPKDRSWKECKILMARVDVFLDSLINYKKENIPPDVVKETKKYIADPEFDPDKVLSKSQAAAGLCSWVINIIKFHEVYEVVEPKRKALETANNELEAARSKLQTLNAKITELEEKLGVLTEEFESAKAEKDRCQQEAEATATTIDLANRLVNGLASENVRWHDNVANFKKSGITLPGDVLLVTAFISYVGCFTRQYRTDLMDRNWLPFLGTLKEPIPRTEELDVLSMLTDDAQIAKWNNEGLPTDRMSAENATILTNSSRWPLIIDPQLQGIKWIKQKYGKDLQVVRLGHKNYLDIIETSLSYGHIVLIENIGETVDAVLDPLLGRNLVKKGRAIKMGDKEIDFNPSFRLILHTKLANPHYKPEMQAQTTLINFTVTRDGLEEQLLGEVVKAERPDLEASKAELTKQQNIFKITLAELEDELLARLAAAGEDILSDTALVLNLESTKKTAAEIEVKVIEAKETSIQLDEAREEYRPVAARGSLLYFILNDLHKINQIYQFSLKAFNVVFKKAVLRAIPGDNLEKRLINLIDNITFSVFMYTNRGLFERDKLIFMAQLAIQILLHKKEIATHQLDYLLRFPIAPNETSPVDFLTNTSWGGIKTLAGMDDFRNLDRDIEGSAKTWKKFVDSECPEKEKFPQEWKNKTPLEKLCMMRALRADRMTYAVKGFIEEKLGKKFTEARAPEFAKSYEETSSSTPVFFILSPGVDPLKDVEKQGRKLGFTFDRRNFHNVSLGQGQEIVAENAMDVAAKKGHWVILQNIHLVARWLPTLEKKMEQCTLKAHKKFRLYISAEASADPSSNIIPQGILESSIKITNEPPTGMLANLHKALDNFSQDTLEMCTKEAEFKAILFSLCYFHAVVAERRKFGPQGWNRSYPFNAGDLTISVHVLYNYLEASSQVPWEDLRYLFGEIMYGGHITDDWDRRLCRTYLVEYMSPLLLQGDLILAKDFPAPPNLDYAGYHQYIDSKLPPESPYLYGLHPNAEIGFLTTTSEVLFRTLFEMQPRDTGGGGGAEQSRDEKVKQILEEFLDRIPEIFNMIDVMSRTEERTPYIIVAFQECERMNILVKELAQTLKELDLGLKGELTITEEMEALQEALFMDNVPDSWTSRAYPSMYTLGPWFADLQTRYKELEMWTGDFNLPSSVWLAGFFNPQSFLTAIMQSTARKNEWPLDKMCLYCDVTKKFKEEITAAPREGAYINGLFMDGARWDLKLGSIADSKLKDLYPLVPVIFIKAITQDKQDLRNMYQCPVYKTRMRGPTFVWTFNLKTKERESKWTLAGVAILLQI